MISQEALNKVNKQIWKLSDTANKEEREQLINLCLFNLKILCDSQNLELEVKTTLKEVKEK